MIPERKISPLQQPVTTKISPENNAFSSDQKVKRRKSLDRFGFREVHEVESTIQPNILAIRYI
jgi:hypothetical protein